MVKEGFASGNGGDGRHKGPGEGFRVMPGPGRPEASCPLP